MSKRLAGLTMAVALAASACGAGGESESAAPADESISVAGAWTLDIVNPDGIVAEHVEFQNAFIGQKSIADLLSMATTQTGWQISAFGPDAICSGGNGGCFVTANFERDPITDELVVSGDFTVDSTGTITQVFGNIVTAELGSQNFSGKDLLAPVDVVAGQSVLIEIRYSFS